MMVVMLQAWNIVALDVIALHMQKAIGILVIAT